MISLKQSFSYLFSLVLATFFLFFSVMVVAVNADTELNVSVVSDQVQSTPKDIWVGYDSRILEGLDLDLYYQIINNLRCPVCQGQSIAESDTEIAIDLKSMVYQKIAEGLNEGEIKDLLVDRYGYYVDFEPPVNQATAPLWFFPFLIAVFGILFVIYRSRTRRKFEKWK